MEQLWTSLSATAPAARRLRLHRDARTSDASVSRAKISLVDHLRRSARTRCAGRTAPAKPMPGTQPTSSCVASHATACSIDQLRARLADAPALVAAVDHQPPQERVRAAWPSARPSSRSRRARRRPRSPGPTARDGRRRRRRRARRPRRATRRWATRGAAASRTWPAGPTGRTLSAVTGDEPDVVRRRRRSGRARRTRCVAQQAVAGVVEPLAADPVRLRRATPSATKPSPSSRRIDGRFSGSTLAVIRCDRRTGREQRGRPARRPPRLA